MKVRHIILISLILLMMGCCRSHEYSYTRYPRHSIPQTRVIPVAIDENFGDADRVEIIKAIEQWNYVLNGNMELVVSQAYMNPGPIELADIYRRGGFMIVKAVGGVKFKIDKSDKYILAFCDVIGGRVVYVLRDRINNWDLYWLMMHEIAHLLGAAHDSHLMSPYYTPIDYQCVDKKTAAQVAKHLQLKENNLNYCFY